MIELSEDNAGWYLYSFAPASGIGFYQRDDAVYRFDLVTKEQSQLEGAALVAMRAEFDQLRADINFATYDELVSFTSAEYLRDKKNTLYALLLTQDLGEESNRKTLRLLNEYGFREVQFSEHVIPILTEIADPQRVTSVVQLAYDLGLENVQECLGNELPSLTFDSVRQMIDEAQNTNLARRWLSRFEETLELLRCYVSAAKTVPKVAYQPIMAFCNYSEHNVASLSANGLNHLSYLLIQFDRSSPAVNYARAIASREPEAISDTFTAALIQSEADTVMALGSRLNELSFARDNDVVAAGKRFLESGIRWTAPSFWPRFMLVELATGHDEDTRKSVSSVAREIYLSNRGRTKFSRTRLNLQFSIDFALPDKLLSISQNWPWYAESLSFWFALYADPDFLLDHSLQRTRLFRFFEEWFGDLVNLPYTETSEQVLFYAYNASNLFSLYLMYPKGVYESDLRYIIWDLLRRWRYEHPRELSRSQPWNIFLSNLLAWALQTRQQDFVDFIVAHIRDLRDEKLTLSPFIRIIL
jgi:hypothetical protein